MIDNVESWSGADLGELRTGIAVGMIAFTGIETISNMAEEARDACRTMVRGTGLTVLAVLFMYALLPLIALSAMPVSRRAASTSRELGTTYAEDPVLGMVENMGLGTEVMEIRPTTWACWLR